MKEINNKQTAYKIILEDLMYHLLTGQTTPQQEDETV